MNAAFALEKPEPAKSRPSFKSWWDAGYRDLLPVVPPDANVSPKSHVAHGKGKSPGVRYHPVQTKMLQLIAKIDRVAKFGETIKARRAEKIAQREAAQG